MKKLPIHNFRNQIVEAVRNNSVVVITAETGAGKSTQVPQFLLDEGHDLVVTQPRRLAARTVAERVAEEIGENIGQTVGYRTAVDRRDSPATKCLFCTDGLALVRELMGQNRGILVLDEVHEWNENMEVLVAWAKRQTEAGSDFKVVLMSATLEAEKLAAFFGGAPVISVPGRLFPVHTRQASMRLVDDVATLVAEGRNVLVFHPGKQEIEDTCAALEQMQVNAKILPLHGQLTAEEQSRCFKHYDCPKVVVSTNVAQTSVTIDDIDAVVDSGLERRIELVDGVEGLYLKPISVADSTQRKGRAGRTKEGLYIDHCEATRPDFPVAEILRKRLDQTVLRLAIAGFDMEELEFFHQPDKSDIHDARRTLIGLGCMNADGSVTKIGKLVNRLPVSVQYARMLVEADRLGVVDDVLTVAAILEQGGITVPPPSRNQPDRPDWRRMVPDESESDVMGQLVVWRLADDMTKDEMREKGISLRNYFRAKEVRRRLEVAIRKHFNVASTDRREDILKAVCAGMVDHLFRGDYGSYQNGEDGVDRELGSASLVRGAEWLVGKPFDLQIKTRRGTMTLRLIELASKVNPMWLTEVAPQLVEEKIGLIPRYDPEKDVVVSTTKVFFNGQMLQEEIVADGAHPEAAKIFASWVAQVDADACELPLELEEVLKGNRARIAKARELNVRAGEDLFPVPSHEELTKLFTVALEGARRVAEIRNLSALLLPALDRKLVGRVLAENPDRINVLGREVEVKYRTGNSPYVRLDFQGKAGRDWLQLSDDGIYLPSGREIYFSSAIEGYDQYFEVASSQFKVKAREYLHREMWNNWNWEKPELAPPTDSIPPIVEVEYGRCVVTDVALTAFGVFKYDSWYETWKPYWTRDPAEAERLHAQACEKFMEMREEVAREALKKRVGEICDAHHNELPESLLTRLRDTQHGYEGGATTVSEVEALIAEAEATVAALVAALEERAEAERKQRDADALEALRKKWGSS